MRPKLEVSKDCFIQIRATKEERKEMKALAKQQGVSVSDMIRLAVKERAGLVEGQKKCL